MKKMVKVLSVLLMLTLVLGLFSGCGDDRVTIRVYNWGEYIDEDMIDLFEEETGIRVDYTTFNDNESMYAKVKNAGDDSYDVIVPSDYMIKQMIAEDMLAPINFENVPNLSNVDPLYLNPSYDPEGMYSAPYLAGLVGILYNTDETGGEEINSWKALFDPKYAGKVCMLDSMRDSVGLTLKMLGYSMNDTDPAHIEEAKNVLIAQKPNVLAYGTDELTEKVMSGTAAMAMVYPGEGISAVAEQPENLKFVIPVEGSNLAVDSFVIPKNSTHKAEAEAFINFMLRPDVAAANAQASGYATTNKAAKELLPPEVINNACLYPSEDVMQKCEAFTSDNAPYVEAWNEIKAK